MSRREFKFILMFLFFSVIGEFLYGCYMFKDICLSGIISAYDATILSNNFNAPFGVSFGLLLPICASIIGSTIGYEEKKQKLLSCIYTRQTKKTYLKKQALSVFVVAFFTVLFCLTISMILAVIMFPIQGHNTMFQADYNKLLNADSEFILDYLYRFHPYLNIFLFIVVRALFAGAFAFMAYGISFMGKWMNRITIIVTPFVFVVCMQLFFQIMKRILHQEVLRLFFSTNIMAMNHYGRGEMFVIVWIVIVLVGYAGLKSGVSAEDDL